MDLRGDNIVVHDLQAKGVVGIVEDVVLDTTVHATGDLDITADGIGTLEDAFVHESPDALGTIAHEIDAHDMDWLIRVSSLRVNASINAINDGRLNVYTANVAGQAYIDLHEDVTSGSGDNHDELGGGVMRFVAAMMRSVSPTSAVPVEETIVRSRR